MRNERARGRTDGWMDRQIVMTRNNYKKKRIKRRDERERG